MVVIRVEGETAIATMPVYCLCVNVYLYYRFFLCLPLYTCTALQYIYIGTHNIKKNKKPRV